MPICTIHTIFSIHTKSSEYLLIHAIHTIHTTAYQHTFVLTNTYQYRQIQTNTFQYIQHISLLTNTYKYSPVHTIHTNTNHTSNTDQYRSIGNTYKCLPIQASTLKFIPIQTHADK